MGLISLPVEFNKKKIDGRYRLMIAVAKRARELSMGAQPKIATKAKKMTTIALEEVISGSVKILSGEAAVKAKERASRLTYENMMDEAKQKELLPEDLTELEKDLKIYLHGKGEKSDRNIIKELFPEEGK